MAKIPTPEYLKDCKLHYNEEEGTILIRKQDQQIRLFLNTRGIRFLKETLNTANVVKEFHELNLWITQVIQDKINDDFPQKEGD